MILLILTLLVLTIFALCVLVSDIVLHNNKFRTIKTDIDNAAIKVDACQQSISEVKLTVHIFQEAVERLTKQIETIEENAKKSTRTRMPRKSKTIEATSETIQND